MATDPVIDFNLLLAEIPGDNPAGADLSTTGLLAELNELRREDDAENVGDWELRERKTANWPKLVKVATEALATKSKDLRIAAQLSEALVQQHGLAGLRDGIRLMRELQEKFWDHVYPTIAAPADDEDEGGIEVRAAAIGKLDRLLPLPVKFIKVTKPKMGDQALKHTDWETARYMEFDLKGKKNAEGEDAYSLAVAEGKTTGEMFTKAVTSTPRAYYEGFVADLDAAAEEIRLLNQLSGERYAEAEQAPYLSELAKVLEKLEEMLGEIEKVHGPLRAAPPGETASPETGDGTPSSRPTFAGDGIPMQPADREDALQRLRAVAGYFRKAEPHSPVTYLVERAIAWAAMPLDQWLAEIVKDEASLAHIRETLGVRPGESAS